MCEKRNDDSRERRIREIAFSLYVKFQKKGVTNDPFRDWLQAEDIYDNCLKRFLWTVSQYLGWVGGITAILAMVFTGCTAWLLREQIRLENRPFISIEQVQWNYMPDTGFFSSTFIRQNYGVKPAEDYRLRNCHAIILGIKDVEIEKKMRDKYKDRYLPIHAINERNRLILSLMEIFAAYFKENPDAEQTSVESFIDSLTPQSKKLTDKDISTYNDELLFRRVEVNKQGIQKYYQTKISTVFPQMDKVKEDGLRFQMGPGGISSVSDGPNLLILYWALQYKDIQGNSYSTHSLGYSDKNSSRISRSEGGHYSGSVRDFQSLTSEQLKKAFLVF